MTVKMNLIFCFLVVLWISPSAHSNEYIVDPPVTSKAMSYVEDCELLFRDSTGVANLHRNPMSAIAYKDWNENTVVMAHGDFELYTQRARNLTMHNIRLSKYEDRGHSKKYSVSIPLRSHDEWNSHQYTKLIISFTVIEPSRVRQLGCETIFHSYNTAVTCGQYGRPARSSSTLRSVEAHNPFVDLDDMYYTY